MKSEQLPSKEPQGSLFLLKKMSHTFVITVLALVTVLGIFSYSTKLGDDEHVYPLMKPYMDLKNPVDAEDPWKDVPKFQLFLRMTSYPRFVMEFQRWFLTSYKLYFPPKLALTSLVIGMDDNAPKDRAQGAIFKSTWPYPKVYFFAPENPNIYLNSQRYRMYWDQFYPDKCVDAEFVGYTDSDSMFSSTVTPRSLFENGKPIVNARIGAGYVPWSLGTQLLLGHPQVLQCMSYFPVIIKVAHIIEMREYIAKRMNTTFDAAFTRAMAVGSQYLCQYAVFCTYVWLFHRDEYRFHLQMVPNDKWDGVHGGAPSMISLDYIRREMKPSQLVPKPRISLHARHLLTKTQQRIFDWAPPATVALELILKEGLCYNGGFSYCPNACKGFNRTAVFYSLYVFEWLDWIWDKRCLEEQEKYLEEVKSVVQYYWKTGQPVLGANSTEQICKRIG